MLQAFDNEVTAGQLRVAAMAIAAYDALWTLPAEWSIYREQRSLWKLTRACILFILIRYTSIATIVVSNIGFFDHSFTEESCSRYYLAAPIMKAVQTTISQAIIGIRTCAIGHGARWVRIIVIPLFVLSVAMEFFANIYLRVPYRSELLGPGTSCTSGNGAFKIVWAHYVAAMVYDAVCLSIATGLIWAEHRQLPGPNSMDNLSKLLFQEGVVYFTWLTAANVLNLIFYRTPSIELQSAGATLGYALTWIMSQRLLIHLHEYKNRVSTSHIAGLTSARRGVPPLSPHSRNRDASQHAQETIELGLAGIHTIQAVSELDYNNEFEGFEICKMKTMPISTDCIVPAHLEEGFRGMEGKKQTRHELMDSDIRRMCRKSQDGKPP